MTYTYYSTHHAKENLPQPAGNFPRTVDHWIEPKFSRRFGGHVLCKAVYDRPLSDEVLLASGLLPGRIPQACEIACALDFGMLAPQFRDGLLCIVCDEPGLHEEIVLSLPGSGKVSDFWNGGLGRAARAVRETLRIYLADDELAETVIELIASIRRFSREAAASSQDERSVDDKARNRRLALMAEVAESSHLADLVA